MIPSELSPAARHSELVQWHRQIKSLRRNAPADAIAGIDAQSRQVCVVMPQDSASVKSVANYDWSLLSKALGEMVIESREIASKLGLKEPKPFPLETEELAACPLSMLDDLISTTLNTDAAKFVLLKESLNLHLGIMLSNAGKADWGAVDQSVQTIIKAENQILFDQPMRLCAYQAGASDILFEELNHLKGDRVLIMAALNSHFLTFRRSMDKRWHKLESAAYQQHEQELIRPGDYLKQRTFHGYEGQLDDPSVGTLEIICIEGETLSGILTASMK